MKKIEDFLEKIAPPKEKKFLHTIYDGLHTFLFQPKETTVSGTHVRDGMDLKRTMVHVVIALQLCYVTGSINMGHQFFLNMGLYPGILDGILPKLLYGLFQLLPLFVVVHVVGLGIEFFFAAQKGHPIEEGFLVSGALIPMIMPPDTPLWMVAVATAFAVIVAKEAFGGTGMNILNVALTARVFVFFAYPGEISGNEVWIANDFNILHSLVGFEGWVASLQAETLQMANAAGFDQLVYHCKDFAGSCIGEARIDGISGATPLALGAAGGWTATGALSGFGLTEAALALDEPVQAGILNAHYFIFDPATNTMENVQQFTVANMAFGFIPGSIGEMSKVAVIAGAGILIASGIGSWRIMLSMLIGASLMGVILNIIGGSLYGADAINHFVGVPWYYHLIMGSFFFAAAFMATDPVTAASTPTGKIFYGLMIGMLGMVIRVLNPAYPEGWMLAILFMNVFAPLIDHMVLQANVNRRLARVAVQ